MAVATAEQELAASADTVWALVGPFGALDRWHPAVERLELEEGGKLRQLHITGNALFREREEAHDDRARAYTYAIVTSPLPVTDYHSTLTVSPRPDGSHCHVTWTGRFKAEGVSDAEAEKIVSGIYRAGLDALKQEFG